MSLTRQPSRKINSSCYQTFFIEMFKCSETFQMNILRSVEALATHAKVKISKDTHLLDGSTGF